MDNNYFLRWQHEAAKEPRDKRDIGRSNSSPYDQVMVSVESSRKQFRLFRDISVPVILFAILNGSQQLIWHSILLVGTFLMRTAAALEGKHLQFLNNLKFCYNVQCKTGNHATIDGAFSDTGYLPSQLRCIVPKHFSWFKIGIDHQWRFVG